MRTLLELIQITAEYFERRGIEESRLNSELIFAHVLGCARLDLYLQHDRPLEEPLLARIRPFVKRRGNREPLQYIIGKWEFDGFTLKVDRRALIPRPETEELAAMLVEMCLPPPGRVLDLGTGAGAIAIALAGRWQDTRVTAVDNDPAALELARENLVASGFERRIECVESTWFGSVEGRYGLIVSNPPYLSESEWESAEPEVRAHEPKCALVAGSSGLADLNRIIEDAPDFLEDSGCLALEIGTDHHESLTEYARARGYARWQLKKDLSGRNRFFFLFT